MEPFSTQNPGRPTVVYLHAQFQPEFSYTPSARLCQPFKLTGLGGHGAASESPCLTGTGKLELPVKRRFSPRCQPEQHRLTFSLLLSQPGPGLTAGWQSESLRGPEPGFMFMFSSRPTTKDVSGCQGRPAPALGSSRRRQSFRPCRTAVGPIRVAPAHTHGTDGRTAVATRTRAAPAHTPLQGEPRAVARAARAAPALRTGRAAPTSLPRSRPPVKTGPRESPNRNAWTYRRFPSRNARRLPAGPMWHAHPPIRAKPRRSEPGGRVPATRISRIQVGVRLRRLGPRVPASSLRRPEGPAARCRTRRPSGPQRVPPGSTAHAAGRMDMASNHPCSAATVRPPFQRRGPIR
jgi:hypothetical protein